MTKENEFPFILPDGSPFEDLATLPGFSKGAGIWSEAQDGFPEQYWFNLAQGGSHVEAPTFISCSVRGAYAQRCRSKVERAEMPIVVKGRIKATINKKGYARVSCDVRELYICSNGNPQLELVR